MKKYIIKGTTDNELCPWTGERLYWSNRDGWVNRESADEFMIPDRAGQLPLNGEWEQV